MKDSPFDNWYIVSVIERVAWNDPSGDEDEEAPTWENYHLVRATKADEAFDKAKALYDDPTPTTFDERKGQWEFVGVRELLPIYEPLEDGSEIMFTDRSPSTKSEAERLTFSKAEIVRYLTKAKK